jgi:hypothetical protein
MTAQNLPGNSPTQLHNMTHNPEHWHPVPDATHLIVLEENVTVLCESHAEVMHLTCRAAGVPAEFYRIDPEEEPIVCQACHLAEVKRPKIHLH